MKPTACWCLVWVMCCIVLIKRNQATTRMVNRDRDGTKVIKYVHRNVTGKRANNGTSRNHGPKRVKVTKIRHKANAAYTGKQRDITCHFSPSQCYLNISR